MRVALEYPASIKVHDPCHAGVLVELCGEFDVSCLAAVGHALSRASDFGSPTFADLSGVTFMDALCIRELASWSRTGALRLCRPSWQVELSVAACGLEESIEIRADDDPGYEAVIAEACRCKRTERTSQRREHHLYEHAGPRTDDLGRSQLPGETNTPARTGHGEGVTRDGYFTGQDTGRY